MKLRINNVARVSMLYGYALGQELLRNLGRLLQDNLGGLGEVFCQGGVNFSILFETNDEQILSDYYRRIYDVCTGGLKTGVGTIPVSLSGGAIINPGARRGIEQTRSCLVFALEESHYHRNNELVFFRRPEDVSGSSNIPLLARIHADALESMQYFLLRYQPIVDMATGRTVGAEALLRWSHPNYGEVRPGTFISFLEDDACYYRLGLRILEEAVKAAGPLREQIPDFRISVNVTALQFRTRCFTSDVTDVLRRLGYPPEGLVLELTERCKEMDSRFLAARIAEFRSLGVHIAFDDLGTGYSTISLLMNIPVDEIKLDQDFVRELNVRENYQIFVKSLVLGSRAPENGYTICFEGVETEDMLEELRGYGNHLAQGYHFARPLLLEDFRAYLRREAEAAAADKPSDADGREA